MLSAPNTARIEHHDVGISGSGSIVTWAPLSLRPQAWPQVGTWQRAAGCLHMLLSLPVLLRWHFSIDRGSRPFQWSYQRHLTVGAIRVLKHALQIWCAAETAATRLGSNPSRPCAYFAFNVRRHAHLPCWLMVTAAPLDRSPVKSSNSHRPAHHCRSWPRSPPCSAAPSC
jgi:hypothetical protein